MSKSYIVSIADRDSGEWITCTFPYQHPTLSLPKGFGTAVTVDLWEIDDSCIDLDGNYDHCDLVYVKTLDCA